VTIERFSGGKHLLTKITMTRDGCDMFRVDVIENIAALRLIVTEIALPQAVAELHHLGPD
jgi:hypothetical protein